MGPTHTIRQSLCVAETFYKPRFTWWRLPMLRGLSASHMQKLALISVLTVTAGHVVAAHISPRPAVHASTASPLIAFWPLEV